MERAAVFQIGSLGDSIVSIPSLQAMRELVPECSEYILVSHYLSNAYVAPADIFNMVWQPNGNVSYLGHQGFLRRWNSVAGVIRQLRRYRPKYCVYLMPSARSAAQVNRDRLFFRAAGIRELVGFRPMSPRELEETGAGGVLHREAYLRLKRLAGNRTAETFNRYAVPPLIKPNPDSIAGAREWLALKRADPSRRLIAMCPFTNVPARDWPMANVAELVKRLAPLANVVILGGKKDSARASSLTEASPHAINGCGAFGVKESAALLSLCRLAVTMDSGPMHLASAVGIPDVVIQSRYDRFGRWLPLGTGHTILYRDVPCAGCRSRICLVPGHPCMSQISVGDVFAAVMRKLEGGASKPQGGTCTRILNL